MSRRPCGCGGEVQLEWFDPIKRQLEWFMRCLACGAMSEPSSSAEAAETQWAATAPVAQAV